MAARLTGEWLPCVLVSLDELRLRRRYCFGNDVASLRNCRSKLVYRAVAAMEGERVIAPACDAHLRPTRTLVLFEAIARE